MWKRIIAPAVVVSLFWVIVGGTTSYFLYWQGRALDRVLEENLTSILAAKAMEETVWRMHASVLQAAFEKSVVPNRIEEDLERQFERSLQSAEVSAMLPEELASVQRIRNRFAAYSSRCRRANNDSADGDTVFEELQQLGSQVAQACEEIVRINENVLHDASRRRQQLTTLIVLGRSAMLIVGPGLGLLMGFRLARQLNQSMTKISVSLQTVAGDLEHEVGRLEITPQADLPLIQRQLDTIADRIREVIQELHQARRETMRAERLVAVGELAAGVAHELRNPLTSVKLLIQTMQHRLRPNMPDETFEVVLEEISRMETTIQGLLDFARPPIPHRALHDLRLIVRRAVNLTEGKARQSGVCVTTQFASEPVWVKADAEQLHQVCINLLLNGIESMTTGGAFDIHVESDERTSMAIIRFEDTGEGIPETIMPRLFEPFVTSKDHGTGLGLAVSRRIILNHSGRLTAENRSGGGATLTIELPLDHVPVQRVGSHAHPVAGR